MNPFQELSYKNNTMKIINYVSKRDVAIDIDLLYNSIYQSANFIEILKRFLVSGSN